jgi:hypothetical protein
LLIINFMFNLEKLFIIRIKYKSYSFMTGNSKIRDNYR